MVRNPLLRSILAFVMGGAAGASFCISILPMTLQMGGAGGSDALAFYLSRFLLPMALVWGIAGLSIARVRHLQAAGISLALVGVVTGTGITALALAPVLEFLAVAGITGLIYGYLGGLILGRLFALPVPREDDL